jgi:hypothetical protein
MARVKVRTDAQTLGTIGRVATQCKGEFFGTWNGWQSFGFRNRHCARLFANRMTRERLAENVQIYG